MDFKFINRIMKNIQMFDNENKILILFSRKYLYNMNHKI